MRFCPKTIQGLSPFAVKVEEEQRFCSHIRIRVFDAAGVLYCGV